MTTDDDKLRWKVSPDWVYQRFYEVGRDPQRPRPFFFGRSPVELANTVDADPPRLAQIAATSRTPQPHQPISGDDTAMTTPSRPLYYILEGDTPVPVTDLMAWATWSEDRHKRIVARTYLSRTGDVLPTEPHLLIEPDDTHVMVSTVFLGSDHGYAWRTDDTTPPILFETMIRLYDDEPGDAGDDGAGFLAPQWRYATAAHARATHTRIVAQAQDWLRAGRSLADVADDEWVDEHEEDTRP